jgi:uncharacterized secreted protein with C-terminal beta-propeller domain
MRRTIITAIAVFALFATACSMGDASPTSTTRARTSGTGQPVVNALLASHSLVQFDQCEAFLDYVVEHAVDLVGPYGFDWGGGYRLAGAEVEFFEDISEELSAASDGFEAPVTTVAASETQRAGDEFSTTNLQEVGVDEPDIVKTDGRIIVALSQGTLYLVDVTGFTPRVIGETGLNDFAVRDLFLAGDRVYAIGGGYGGPTPLGRAVAPEGLYYPSATSQMVEISIDGEPKVERSLVFDGAYVSARMVDDTIRVVISSTPHGFVWAAPEGSGLKAEREATEKNRAIVRNSDIDNWVPYYVAFDADGDVTDEGNLVDCDRAFAPNEFAGLSMVTVMTVDASTGLQVEDATGVLASGETVYASQDSLYVATQRWIDWNVLTTEDDIAREIDGATTSIHMFDITDPRQTNYVASGEVQGYLLNQFAMSEYDGHLRVASTTQPINWGSEFESESMVTVLGIDGNELVVVGQVDGLGEGERIYSVRFMGDVGYVVTFRQTDPLYTVDLSDPTDPTVEGELKIQGYSAYLHPISEDYILGVGQDATNQGRILGTQVSLFDVSDLSDPRRVAQYTLDEGTNSEAEYDHRAFLYWPGTGLTMIPVQSWSWEEKAGKEEVFFGAIGLEVAGDDIEFIRRVNHPGGSSDNGSYDWMAQINRSIVIGDSVYTISQKGILRSDLDTLEREAWTPFVG